ncbi:MAG: hypothetical protein FJ265_14520 [Planctomycetes bacterium]|nr:hypothetical protein [Planctomycetota bacterium]
MRNQTHPALLAALPAILFAAATSSAQAPPAELVALTAQIPSVVHRDQLACTDIACTPPGFPQMVGVPYQGGVGWDPKRSGAWISNGPLLALVDDGCNYICSPITSPTPGNITGLEVVESLNEIWATDTNSNLVRMAHGCPPMVVSVCNLGILPTPTRGVSGLAVDEGRGLVFVCGGDWTTGASQLRVSLLGNPCVPFHVQPVTSTCSTVPLRPLTGLAVDWGNHVLYMTDGLQTVGWAYAFNPAGPSIVFAPLNCCLAAPTDMMIGLAVRPARPVSFGPPCASGTCPACPMVHGLVGDPNLGNGSFALRLTGVPAGSIAFAALSIGGCTAPGTAVPGLCGPIWLLPPLWGSLGPNFPGGFGCTNTSFAMPLPANVAFAGLPVGSQCLALCPGGGTTLSNCLSWVMQGN